MDRVSAMLGLLVVLASLVLMTLSLFAFAPVFCSCVMSLLYTLYFFMANEEGIIHRAQEFENRFWTIFAILLSTALFFAKDSPIAIGRYSPSLGFIGIVVCGYGMHVWDRYLHRIELSRHVTIRRGTSSTTSLNRLKDLGIPVEDQLDKINSCLNDIDQLLVPSTINNIINLRFVMRKEREIISVFEECDARALNYLIGHVKLGLLFYKIKDHRNFSGQHRTQVIQLLAVDRIAALTVLSKVIVLHALQGLKLQANTRAEYWVKNILLETKQDDLSELKTLTDAKGVYLDMNKLIYDDIKSDTIRQDILSHIKREAAVQLAHMQMGTRKAKLRSIKAWRKILSDVDDTLFCSGGHYPAGIDKRYGRKVVYPGVLSFYRELDLGTAGPEEWPETRVGNLVFLSARPHFYKDVSEKQSFAKFEKLQLLSCSEGNTRKGMHTTPSILSGDLESGRDYILANDFEPLALKKFDNFKRYVSIYPEFTHVFVCDNGQGDVRAGELMFDAYPYEFEALYVHLVKDQTKTHGYAPERWRKSGLKPCFFRTYPEAALHAATRYPPVIRATGLRRVCCDAVHDFQSIQTKQWPSQRHKIDRRIELNQSIWRANQFLSSRDIEPCPLIEGEQTWLDGSKVRTPYGIATIRSFDPIYDMYEVELDWRPLNIQVEEHSRLEKAKAQKGAHKRGSLSTRTQSAEERGIKSNLETVVEVEEADEEMNVLNGNRTKPEKISDDPEAVVKQPERQRSSSIGEESDGGSSDGKISSSPIMVTQKHNPSENSTEATSDTDESINSDVTQRDSITSIPEIGAHLPVVAHIQGRYIAKYTPPVLPKIVEKDRGSLFSFWGPSTTEPAKKKTFNEGDECTTPYGKAVVVEHREETGIVVVDMIGWSARASLVEKDVEIVSKGALHILLRPFKDATRKKPLGFPYAEGKVIKTPFGEGVVVRPLPPPSKKDAQKDRRASTKDGQMQTLGISLNSWVLADDSKAMLYCTVDTVRAWKDLKAGDGKSSIDLLSALRSGLVSGLRFLGPKKEAVEEKAAPQFEQYYSDGAAVTTSYGDGVVRNFRTRDGFYEVSLVNWTLANGLHPTAILQIDDISYRIAKGCNESYPCLTCYGLTGTLQSVEPKTGVHIITVPSAGMVCYLQPESVIKPLKATVGEDVLTAVGEGKVRRYRLSDDIYEIEMNGWNATLFATGDKFSRVNDGMHDRNGPFGIDWLFRFLFFSSDNKAANNDGKARSRSNSLASAVSASGRSTSQLSAT